MQQVLLTEVKTKTKTKTIVSRIQQKRWNHKPMVLRYDFSNNHRMMIVRLIQMNPCQSRLFFHGNLFQDSISSCQEKQMNSLLPGYTFKTIAS